MEFVPLNRNIKNIVFEYVNININKIINNFPETRVFRNVYI